jgi:ribosomal protein S4
MLERRLDISLYRCGFFPSVYAARQWILHRRVFVNGKLSLRPSQVLKPGDIVTIDQKWHNLLKQQIFDRFIQFFKNLSDVHKLPQEYPNLRSIFLTKPLHNYDVVEIQDENVKSLNNLQDIKLNHDNTSRNYQKLFTNSTLYSSISPIKPVHLEISFDIFSFIYLYAPQKMAFPMLLDLAAIRKSF